MNHQSIRQKGIRTVPGKKLIPYLIIALLLGMSSYTYGQRCYVDSSIAVSGSGASWSTAYKTLQEALSFVGSSSTVKEIWIRQGTYYPSAAYAGCSGCTSRDYTFQIPNGVKVYGGFAGSETDTSQRTSGHETILSGNLGAPFNNFDNSYHVVLIANTTIPIVLDRLTITAGKADDGSSSVGLYMYGNMIFPNQGGGLYLVEASNVLLNNCIIGSNAAYAGGAGVFCYNTALTAVNTTFTTNGVTYNTGGGGGICQAGNDISLIHCNFTSNAARMGGGIYNFDGTLHLYDCILTVNIADYGGGGLFSQTNGSVDIQQCLFYNNTANKSDGGGFYDSESSRGQVTISQSDFISNNCLVGTGGGMALKGFGTRSIKNSIIWANSASGSRSILNYLLIVTASNSIIEDGFPGTGNMNTAPLFINLASLGGSDGIWRTADDGLSVQPGSPAINAGSNAGVPAGLSQDITGTSRIRQGTVDIGAYETPYMNCQPFSSGIAYVDSSIAGSGNGSSWATAFKTLDEALYVAGSCSSIQQVWMKKGTYIPMAYPTGCTDCNSSRDYAFALRNNLAIYGGFAGSENNTNQRIAGNTTVLSGNNNSYHVLVSVGNDSTARLDRFTITGGAANDGSGLFRTFSGGTITAANGGGLSNYSSSPRITNCVFNANTTSSNGGGMYNFSSSPQISGCTFSNNTGSAIYNTGTDTSDASSPVVTSCVFTANTGSFGGAVYNIYTRPRSIYTNCIFSGNNAGAYGGAVNNSSAAPTFINCTFRTNSAGTRGGALQNEVRSFPVLRNCIVWDNTAGTGPNIYDRPTGGASSSNVTYSLVQGGWGGTGNLNADPLFADTSKPAGTDGIWGTTDDGLRPISCSPALNTGSNAAVPASITTDLAGAPRTLFTNVDMGPYEKQTAVPASPARLATLSGTGANTIPFTKACDDGTWTYYAIPGNADSIGFAIAWNGNTAARDAATLSVVVNAANGAQTNAAGGSWAMRRYWNVNLNGQTLSTPVKVRFYYSAADTVAMKQSATASGLRPVSAVKWFKTIGTAYSPGLVGPDRINSPYTILVPSAAGTENNTAWVQFDNITSFSGGTAIVNAGNSFPLPVTIRSFEATKTASGAHALLSWEAEDELNLSSYNIERAADGSSFQQIGTLPATAKNKYSFIDQAPLSGINFYRLALLDKNGMVQYSPVRQLTFTGKGGVRVLPNPASTTLQVINPDKALEGTEATILDISGQVMVRFHLAITTEINVSGWPSGFYLLRLADGTVTRIGKQ